MMVGAMGMSVCEGHKEYKGCGDRCDRGKDSVS